MNQAVIELENVSVSYGPVDALRDFTLRVPEGRVVALVGPNGAGKTTCLRTLMGLLRAGRGTARVFGQDAWSLPPAERRRIGYLSEEGFAWPEMTFARAVSFVSSFFPSWDAGVVEELVDLLKIPAEKPIGQMSMGEARKAALALTLGPHPQVLLLDDPASGLDPGARRDMISGVTSLLRRSRTTVLLSSHIMTDIERLADDVCLMFDGRAVLHRTLEDLQQRSRRFALPEATVDAREVSRLPEVVRVQGDGADLLVTTLGDADSSGEETGFRRWLRTRGNGAREAAIDLEDLYIDLVHAAQSGWSERPR